MRTRAPLIGALVLGVAVIAAVALAAHLTGRTHGFFTRDLRVLSAEAGAGLPFYAGALSTLTCLVWAAAGAVALAAACVVQRRAWWVAMGLLLLALALDDAYMLHETVGPSKGVDEIWFYVAYALTAAALFVPVLRGRLGTATTPVVVGFLLLGASIVADVTLADQYLMEDGIKFLGAMALLVAPATALTQARLDWTASPERPATSAR